METLGQAGRFECPQCFAGASEKEFGEKAGQSERKLQCFGMASLATRAVSASVEAAESTTTRAQPTSCINDVAHTPEQTCDCRVKNSDLAFRPPNSALPLLVARAEAIAISTTLVSSSTKSVS